jgi:hypothetical protein
MANRLRSLQQAVRAELGGKVFSEEEVALLVRKGAGGNS